MDSNRYAHPTNGIMARLAEGAANSMLLARVRRATFGRVPFPVLASDVVNVVYATWLVDATRARPWLPQGAVLWERNGLTPFTVLSYRHGHFGPRLAGPLRQLFPSPLQSNWRFYLEAPLSGTSNSTTVVFVKNILDSGLYALGTRLFSDALQSHLAQVFTPSVQADEASVAIQPGKGSAPSLAARFERNHAKILPVSFAPFATTWRDAALRLSSQDAAVVPVPSIDRTAFAAINLPVDISALEPLTLNSESLHCPMLQELGALEESLCFHLPYVHFEALSERLL